MSVEFDELDFDFLFGDGNGNDETFLEDLSDLEDSHSHILNTARRNTVKNESDNGDNSKKRKHNPDSEIIAQETERALREMGVDPQSKEGKAKRRQIRNRLSAQAHRNRKNAHIDTMEHQLHAKDVEICSLRNEVARLVAENEYLRKFYIHAALPVVEPSCSFVSYRDNHCGGSNPHTDSEDASHSQQHDLYSTCSSITATASPSDSPYRVAMDSASLPQSMTHLPPSVGVNNVNGGSNSRTVSHVAGPGMMQVSGMARPLSIITLVCMISVMLLGTSHGPNMGVNFFTPYTDSQSMDQHSPLKAGSEMLTLVHSTTGAESRHSGKNHVQQQEQSQQWRRLTEDEFKNGERQTFSRHNSGNSQAEGRERSNSLYDPTLMTPEEETAATSAISALNLDHLAMPSVEEEKPIQKPHNHLRCNPATRRQSEQQGAVRRNVSRPVIYSVGVVNRGLVEDSAVYSDQPVNSVLNGSNAPNKSEISTAAGEFDSQEYSWPAIQAFNYDVQSYSTVVMTDGQALLDPSIVLQKNPFQWTHPTFNYQNMNAEYENLFPTIVENGEGNFDEDIDFVFMDDGEGSDALSPVRALPNPSEESSVEFSTFNHMNLPSVIENQPAVDYSYLTEEVAGQSTMKALLAGSNFITMKLPASSIRIGKDWNDSKSGSVESLMEVFNINNTNSSGLAFSADASVEITGVIVGAKLILSE